MANYILTSFVESVLCILWNVGVVAPVDLVDLVLTTVGHAIKNYAKELGNEFVMQESDATADGDDSILVTTRFPTVPQLR